MNTNTVKAGDTRAPLTINPVQKAKYGTIYKSTGSLLIVADCFKGRPHQFESTVRGAVNSFTPDSSRRMRRYLRDCLSEYRFMLTLTYPGFFPYDGETVKTHLKRFLQELKRYVVKCGGDAERFSAFWFLEFQSRGAPHFHIFLTDQFPKEWVAITWFFIVGSDDLRHQQAGTRIETIRAGRAGILAYAAKYAAKNEQKVVPEGYQKVGRFWGVIGRRDTLSAATFVEALPNGTTSTNASVFLMVKTVNKLLFEGQVELIKRDEGVAVFTINSTVARNLIRARICHMQCVTMNADQLFIDAEVDVGETLPIITRDLINLITEKKGVTLHELEELARKNRKERQTEVQTEAEPYQETLFHGL